MRSPGWTAFLRAWARAAKPFWLFQSPGLLHAVAVVAVGEEGEGQQDGSGGVALGAQVFGDQVGIEVPQPFEADDQHGLRAAEVAVGLGLGSQEGGPRRARWGREEQIVPGGGRAPVGQADLCAQRLKRRHRSSHPFFTQKRVGMGRMFVAEPVDEVQRAGNGRPIRGVAEEVQGGRGPVDGPQALGDDGDV